MSDANEPDPRQPPRPRYSRFFFDLTAELPIDPATGLLRGPQTAQAMGGLSLVDLVEERFALVIGPPYTGKSTVLGQLVGSTALPRIVLFTDLRGLDDRLEPEGWAVWIKDGGPRLWLIDSLDENGKAPQAILMLLRKLPTQRKSELNLLVSCRENEVPASFASDVFGILGVKCRQLLIAPPDIPEAENICGAGNLERVLAAIQTKDLREVSGQPAALEWLATLGPDELEHATKATLWKGIIHAMLEPNHAPPTDREPRHSLDARFRAASRIAFFLEFGDFPSFRATGSDVLAVTPTLDALFPSSEDKNSGLRGAAFEVIRTTGLFRSSGDGFRIHHRHLREWLAAHELARLEPLQIEELVGNGMGEIDPLRARLGEALAGLTTATATQAWLGAALNRFKKNLKETVDEFLGRFLKAAEKAPYGLDPYPFLEQLRTLNRDPVRQALAETNSNWVALTNKQRVILLQIASDLKDAVFEECAQASLTDPRCEESLGEQAILYLDRLGRLPNLAHLARNQDPTQKPRLLARILLTALNAGNMSSLEVLRFGLKRQHGLVDLRAILDQAVADKLTPLEALYCLIERHENSSWSDVVLERAVELLAISPIQPSWPAVFATEIRRAEKEGRYQDLDRWHNVVSRNVALRRALYTSEVAGADTNDLFRVSFSLGTEDVPWMFDLLPLKEKAQTVIRDIYSIASRTKDANTIATLRSSHPDQVKLIEESRARFEQEDKERLERLQPRQRDRPEQLKLESVLRDVLDYGHPPQTLIHRLGWIVFGDWRPNNVTGEFAELQQELQEEVLTSAQAALVAAEPTPIPPGSTISGHILFEASVAEAVIKRFGARSLGAEAVRKWLPALLRALEKVGSITECSEVFPEETIDAFSWFIVRDAEEPDGHPFSVSRAPPALWPSGLARRAVEVANCSVVPSIGRANLLKGLLDVTPTSALDVARMWASSPQVLDQARSTATIGVLLALAPREGLALLRRDLEMRSQQALLDQASAFDSYRGNGVRLQAWGESELGELAEMLFTWFSEETHQEAPYGEAYYVTSQHQLVDARNALIRVLRERSSPEARRVLETIANRSPRLRRLLDQEDQEKKAKALGTELALASGSPPPVVPDPPVGNGLPHRYPESRRVSLRELLRMLNSGEYRLARTSADLLKVLVEVFARINDDIPEDSALLYHDGKHVIEDVLQAYLARRLQDLMPGRIIDREVWQPFNKRADFLVRVRVNGNEIGVPIELKWSNNPETATAARDQLGKKYLLPTNRADGLLVVAWMGKPTRESDLRAAIEVNMQDFQTNYPGKHIALSWLVVLQPPKRNKGKVASKRKPAKDP